MAQLLLYILIIITSASLLFAPWITGLAYVANSLLQPQYIWFWIFEGLPIYRITAGLAILALILGVVQKKIDLGIYKHKQNLIIFSIWILMHLSHLFSPYKGAPASVSPELVLDTLNSIMIMYFVLLPLCQSERALRYLCYVFIFVGAYYTYWANSAYLNQEWYRFINDRLTGPRGSPYRDANVLSTLIVMCLPFVTLLYFRTEKLIIKVAVLLAVPLAWHAMILFSSRAALLASIFTMLPLAYIIRSKKANVVIGLAFLLFLGYQGAMLVERASGTVETARVETDKPINPRLVSWEAGLRLIPKYPILGVGVQKFEAAAEYHFPGMTPHVAHNTFINFAANAGLLTGILFLALIITAWSRVRRARIQEISLKNHDYYALCASSTSLIGFFVCSIFLDLIIYEPLYMALIINLISSVRLNVRSVPFQAKNKMNLGKSLNASRI